MGSGDRRCPLLTISKAPYSPVENFPKKVKPNTYMHSGRFPFLRHASMLHIARMKTTRYFDSLSTRPDRVGIKRDWIKKVVEQPEMEQVQRDGRIRRWGCVPEAGYRYLRVILLDDGETVHNVFFDRGFKL